MMDSQENVLQKASPVEEEAKVVNQDAAAPEVSTTESPEATVETAVTEAPEATVETPVTEAEEPAGVPTATEAQTAPETEEAQTAPEADEAQTVPEAEEAQAAPEAEEAQAAPGTAKVQEADEASKVSEAQEERSRRVYQTKHEVLERVKEIAHSEEAPQKEEVEMLKTVFYKLHIAEREASLKAFVDGGGDPEQYKITPDEEEEAFKAEMGIIKERRQQQFRQQEAEKEANLKRKLEIIEKIKGMVTTPEEASKTYQEFKALQAEWRDIKAVPAEHANDLWRNYQHYVEQFYDLLKLNSEARELDFKKNLEAKTRLCEAAEKLAGEADIIGAFHQLQQLHQDYREIGPVSSELREEIWQRFKAASTVINKRHQQHFDNIRQREEENLAKKTELCEKAEAIIAEENKTSADWDRHTQEIIALQAEWKTVGFAPQKMNVKIFERFRTACDKFFTTKGEHFKALKDTYKENVDKKRALIEKAKALQDSTEWRSTSDKLIALQKEWKTIGMVPRRLGDQLWEEFLGACNKFFEARNAAGAGQRGEERGNLEKKRDVIERIKAAAEEAGDDLQEKVQQLVEEYNSIGHVPFKEKDKLYEEYHAVLDKLYKELNISVAKRRLTKFKDSLKQVAERGEGALDSERARLTRQYEQMKQDLQTYENNLGFLSVSSKKGNSLIDEMKRKVEKLKDDIKLTAEKIKAIDAENKPQE